MVDKAKKFNRADITEFIVKNMPDNPKNKEKRLSFLKKLDEFIKGYWGISGVLLVGYLTIPEIKNYVDNILVNGKDDLWTNFIYTWCVSVWNGVLISDTQSGGRYADVKIDINYSNNNYGKVTVDFGFLSVINNRVQKANQILYNAFVRKVAEYEGKEGYGIEYGRASQTKGFKTSKWGQHEIDLNFWPVEFVDLLEEAANKYKDRGKDDGAVEFKRNDTDEVSVNKTNVDFYIQRMPYKDVVELADKIKNIEFSRAEVKEPDHTASDYFKKLDRMRVKK